MMCDLGFAVKPVLIIDAKAPEHILHRRGIGKMKHIDVARVSRARTSLRTLVNMKYGVDDGIVVVAAEDDATVSLIAAALCSKSKDSSP